jgi:hypothetical protein
MYHGMAALAALSLEVTGPGQDAARYWRILRM